MLTEFAFTPSIFDETIQPDSGVWSAQIERLADKMFPQGYAWPVIIANLFSGGWKNEANKQIQKIQDKNIKVKAMSLFTSMQKVLIDRPMNLEWPEDQLGWCMEAIECGKAEPIERIVACRFAIDEASSLPRDVRCLTEVRGSGFWNGIPVDDSPDMDILVQLQLLKKFCMHAHFISVVTPHINAGSDDETDFLVGVMRSALGRPTAHPKAVFDIHTDGPRNALPGDASIATFANAINARIANVLGPGINYSLTLWPKILHRYIIAGDITIDTNMKSVKKPRWAVSMNHIAKSGDQHRNLLPADWKLLKSDRVRFLAKEFCATSLPGNLYSRTYTT